MPIAKKSGTSGTGGGLQALGQRVRTERERRKWSQADLGKRAGNYSHSAVARLEGGERREPSAGLVYGIAVAFGMTFEELWTGRRPPERGGPVTADVIHQAAAELERKLLAGLPEPSAPPISPRAGRGPRGARRLSRSRGSLSRVRWPWQGSQMT